MLCHQRNRLCSVGSTIHIYKAQRRRTSDMETFCFCCSGNSRSSSSGLPGCSRVRSSPFFIRRFKVGINRRCWVLCIRIFCHHFQLCFNGFYLCGDTGKHSRGSEWAEVHSGNASISPLLMLMCVREAIRHKIINMKQEKRSLKTNYVFISPGRVLHVIYPYIVSPETETLGTISVLVRK